jgi:hypothetical protein
MSVHFDVSKISFFGLDEWSVAVCAWRGCCIEVFARAEHSVADCLRTLAAAGLLVGKDAQSPAAVTRLRALSACIASHDFGGHGRVAEARIAAWEKACELRACLAHGTVKATGSGILIQHCSFDGKSERRYPPREISRIAMIELLAELERAQTLLHQQLGHVKALAGKSKPIAVASQKPDPGSSPG